MSLLFQDNRINHTHDMRLLDSLERSFDDICKSDHQVISVNLCIYKQTKVLIRGLTFFDSLYNLNSFLFILFASS